MSLMQRYDDIISGNSHRVGSISPHGEKYDDERAVCAFHVQQMFFQTAMTFVSDLYR